MWFRRDLRLADNPALLAACEADQVVPLFVVDPLLWSRSGPVRRAYLSRSLAALDEALGGALVVRHGDPRHVVPEVAAESGAGAVHLAADFAPYGSRRDDEVADALAAAPSGVELRRLGSPYAVAPGRVLKDDGTPFRVYSAFQRRWAEHGWRAPVEAPAKPSWAAVKSEALPDEPTPDGMQLPPAGEEAARTAWTLFRDDRLAAYAEGRNLPATDGASGMSTYLKYGEIHPRTMLHDLASGDSASSYRRELAWRDFYADVLWHDPDSARRDLRPEMREMEYDEPGPLFEAWKEGRTGFPIVDAGMRQMRATGRMHNRVRMICASFVVKDLHVWWGHGARHFMHWLADGDLPSNQHGWQWVAGTGTDAAPYYRVFNPTLQGKKFDPDGSYVRRWVEELRDVPASQIHEPKRVPGYPDPIVDHAAERKESLARYERVRSRSQ